MKWTRASQWMGRRVLVTGASGFLGRAVCELLLELGANVHGSWRSRPPAMDVVGHPAVLPADAPALFANARPDLVLHLASPVKLQRDPTLFTQMRRGVLDATAAVAAECLARDIRLVHVGTCEEYGDQDAPFRESMPARPVSPYSALKSAATDWVGMLVRTAGLRATVVRPFRAYGPGGRGGLIPAACRAALAGEPLSITDGTQVREWNQVHAIAAGILAAGAHPDAVGQLLNLGGGPHMSVRDIARRVFVLAGQDPDLVNVGALPRRAGEVDRFWGDHSAALALFGPLPDTGIDDGLLDTLAWHRRVRP